ncbi:MAG: selenocysteine-specific translation elongation factor [Myxococcales bacterium]|nr:selenocysteine-specific translation elongation factor [Myxococcales bacterium]
MRHAVIGTAGHVDHGKTSLVHALTGVMTDRLPEEQRRGITIELGFAPWKLGEDWLVSVIDAPGHRRLVHHMIAGASGIDLVLLVVAADEGVMPQTREHVAACRLLGVRRAVVAVTKLDRADEELGELAGEEARELCAAHGITATVVCCSSVTGAGLDALRAEVERAVSEGDAAASTRAGRRVRLAVDRVLAVRGAGAVVTGTLVAGVVRVGAELRVLGGARELAATARGLQVHGQACERATAPTRLAINLAGVSQHELERGMIITDDPGAQPTRMLDVWLEPMVPLRRGADAAVFVGTARTTARIQPIGLALLTEPGLVRLRLATPLVVVGGDRFVLRGAEVDGPAGAVCGGGVVLDARPSRTMRAQKRVELLDAMRKGEAELAMKALADEVAPRSSSHESRESRFLIEGEALLEAGRARSLAGELVLLERAAFVTRSAVDALAKFGLSIVRARHQTAPLDAGLELETLRAQLTQKSDAASVTAVLFELTRGPDPKLVVVEGRFMRLASFRGATSDSAATAALTRAREFIVKAALNGVSENELVAAGVAEKFMRAALASLERASAVVHAEKLWFDAAAVEALGARIRAHFLGAEILTIVGMKEMAGLSRKQAIPLLEHFDRLRLTRRLGNGSDRGRGAAT